MLFLDIEGFTTLSEQMPPEEVVGTLNDFFGALAAPIVRREGVINQFLGDAIVATFNAPRATRGTPLHAVEAALDILALCADAAPSGRTPAAVRIGINTGPMACGLIGTPDRLLVTR